MQQAKTEKINRNVSKKEVVMHGFLLFF